MLDAAIIAQYQCMTHYGITDSERSLHLQELSSFRAIGKLEAAVQDMHLAHDLIGQIAEAAVNVTAAC